MLPLGEKAMRKELLFQLAQGCAEAGDLQHALDLGNELANLDFGYRDIGRLLDEWQARRGAGGRAEEVGLQSGHRNEGWLTLRRKASKARRPPAALSSPSSNPRPASSSPLPRVKSDAAPSCRFTPAATSALLRGSFLMIIP